MISSFFSWLLSIVFSFVAQAIDVVFGVVHLATLPQLTTFSQYIVSFWDLCFEGIGYFRSAFLIGAFEMNLIVEILTLKLTYKPMIALIKMFIHWFEKLKVG